MSRVIVVGAGGSEEIPIDDSALSIGRAEENDVRLFDPESSRHHCKILRSDGAYKLVDLGSRNGTLVNGRRVQWKLLVPGDAIRIGATSIYFERVPDDAPPTGEGLPRFETLAAQAVDESSANLAGMPASRVPGGDLPGEPIAVETPGAFGEAGELIQKLRRLLDINRAINSELDQRRLLERIIDAAIEVTGAERGFLVLREPDADGIAYRIKVSRNIDRETIKRAETKVSRSVLKRVIQDGDVIMVDDASRDDRFSASDSVIDLNLAAILAAPLRARSAVIGAIYLDNRFRESGFTQAHRDLLEVVSDQAAIAIENARLFEENLEKQRQLERAAREVAELNSALKAKVERQDLELEEVRGQLSATLKPLRHNYPTIITRSPRMHEVLSVIDRVTDIDAPLHIEGESGTGKELIARAVHDHGPRKHRLFVAQNCAAVPFELMESEFFGHVRGAFTGAERDKQGLFEIADGGTLFLDEIGEMHLDLQSKFLRVLQSGELRRVGDKSSRRVDVRIVSATNRDLRKLCREGLFREDLYYRIVVIHVKLPALRERREDVPLLVDRFLARIAERTRQPKRVASEEALEVLTRYDWPGNVRQLQNEVERAVALSSDTIRPEQLSADVRDGTSALTPDATDEGEEAPFPYDTLNVKELARRAQEDVERRAILEALKRAKTKSDAAQLLGVSRPTLDAKIERYEIPWKRGT